MKPKLRAAPYPEVSPRPSDAPTRPDTPPSGSLVPDPQQAAGPGPSVRLGCSPQVDVWKERFGTVGGGQDCSPGPEAGQALTHQYQQKQLPDPGLPGGPVGPSSSSCSLSNKYTGELPSGVAFWATLSSTSIVAPQLLTAGTPTGRIVTLPAVGTNILVVA